MNGAEARYRVVKTAQGWQRVNVCADAERQADLVIEQHRQARARGAAKDEATLAVIAAVGSVLAATL